MVTCTDPSRPSEPISSESPGPALEQSDEAPPGDVVLLGAGDIASCSSKAKDEKTAALLDSLVADRPDAIVFTAGDNAYENGSAADYTNCYGPSWGRFLARTRPALGNHEYTTGTADPYFDYFNGPGTQSGVAGNRGEGWYSYDAGAWHIVVLNSNSANLPIGVGSPQDLWLKADLAASTAQCTLAIWHHARFTSGTSAPLEPLSGRTLPMWQALYDAGAELVLAGHNHTYERFAPQEAMGRANDSFGIRQFVVGTGGRSISTMTVRRANSEATSGTFGVIKLSLGETGYAWRFVPIQGSSFSDSGSASCHGPPPPNVSPVASFVFSCVGLTCSFTDTSLDPDGAIMAWSWKKGNGSTSSKQNTTVTYAAPGSYTVKLTVTDSRGATKSVSRKVTVTG
jgi:hypothetical protein